MSILDQIIMDTETPPLAPTDDALKVIAELAERQLQVLGKGEKGWLKQGPSGSQISDLLAWGKKQEVRPPCGLTDPRDIPISELIALLTVKYAEYRQLSEIQIPLALQAVGMKSFSMADGTGIKVEDDIAVSGKWGSDSGVPQAVLEFLESIGCADVVKDEIKINLGKGETEKAHDLMLLAEQLGVPAVEKLSIHAATLKSLVKEQQEKGVTFPEEYFSIFPFSKTLISQAK